MDNDDVESTTSPNKGNVFLLGLAYDPLDPAYYVGDFLYLCQIFLTSIGIPLNLLLVGTIVFLKRLHLQRNLIWIGVRISNVTVLATHLMEYLAIRWKSFF